MKTTKPKLLLSSPNLEMFLVGLNKFWCNPYSIQLHENGVIVVSGKVMDRLRYTCKGGRFRLEMTNY